MWAWSFVGSRSSSGIIVVSFVVVGLVVILLWVVVLLVASIIPSGILARYRSSLRFCGFCCRRILG